MKILVVDDEPAILEGLLNIIDREKALSTYTAGALDGFEALEKARNFQPDLVITDINMPEMSGFDLMKKLSLAGICKRFIIVSGYDDFEYARKALRYHAIDYILKPINKLEVLGAVERVCGQLADNGAAELTMETYLGDERQEKEYSERMKDIILYIEEYYQNNLSLEDVAECVNLHPNYISTLIKKETGSTFLQYVHTYRIKKAKELIRKYRDLSIHDVALQVGYENPDYFFKVFRKYAGQTPSAYRKMLADH
ncbi:Helix-turn-helix domain-containing protein [Evansella caseinilytica]|uniref:Helix-turn-helix domain-containing protein n=1 Tax=Evansella caseinilytica TaxID=1503961 RepID=A0A1H3V005_9BACI|nr:response regulator [Evansella caseinilytica]SDZ67994.1 Helix-turn-helix domain-containing protein [Evansella caseinilytica]